MAEEPEGTAAPEVVAAPEVARAPEVDVPSQKSEEWAIRVRDLRRRYGETDVLRGVDLDVARGKINIIIGGSGQGKSVLLKHLVGLQKADSGHVWVDGVDLESLSDVELNRLRRTFGMVFQYAALFDSLTIEENVAFPLREHTTMKPTEIRHEVWRVLDALHLPRGILTRFPAEISGGQRKRVGLARALVLKPAIVLYDEPTTGLDPIATKNVDDMIRDISRTTGVTSLVVSHDMASTFRIADRIAMLHEGRIIEAGTPAEIRATQNAMMREFIETSGAVMLDPLPAPHPAHSTPSGPSTPPLAPAGAPA